MVVGLLGRKVGMTQIFDPTGQVIPATVIQAGPCHVLQLRTQQQDGYEAVQLGYLDKPRRLASRAARGQVAKLDSKRQQTPRRRRGRSRRRRPIASRSGSSASSAARSTAFRSARN